MHKLIILRGNSGSGKTTVAKELQQRFGEKEMRSWWVEKDYAPVLHEKTISQEMDKDSIVNMIYDTVNAES